MGKVLAIDAGERRVGLAISDETELLARPLRVLQKGPTTSPLVGLIGTVVQIEHVSRVLVGLPLNADGSEGRQARRARSFANLLRQSLGCGVELWDERLSSVEAERAIRAGGGSVRRRRASGGIDAVAAAVFLQDYLDARHRAQSRAPFAEDGTDA